MGSAAVAAECGLLLENELRIRLSGTEAGVAAAVRDLGGAQDPEGGPFWRALREQHLPFFESADVLWRLVVPPATPPLGLPGDTLVGLGWCPALVVEQAGRRGHPCCGSGSGWSCHEVSGWGPIFECVSSACTRARDVAPKS